MELNQGKSDIGGIFNSVAKPFENYSATASGQAVDTDVENTASFDGMGSGGKKSGGGGGSGGGLDIGGIVNTVKDLVGNVKSDANCKENIRPSYGDLRGMVSGLRGK